MKKLFYLSLIAFTFYSCRSRTVPTDLAAHFDKILQNPQTMAKYQTVKTPGIKSLMLSFDFGSNQLKDTSFIKQLKDARIKYITYAYSDYKKEAKFKQDEFNRERFYSLYQQLPAVFKDTTIHWQVINQNEAKDQASAAKLLHGFVLYYRPTPTMAARKKEIADFKKKIKKLLDDVEPKASESGGDYAYGYARDSVTTISGADYIKYVKDTTVTAVLDRNKNWKKMLIHCDLTGSMMPYAAQLFVWHRLNIDKKKAQYFVFFNDGDNTLDAQKKVGKTGGIYHTKTSNFKQLMTVADTCIRNGFGGDAPENDVEAILSGLQKCPDCEDIILIADNWANMRDYRLLSKINKPVKIILCGTYFGINTQYLDLARATGGSIHTIEADITNLMKLREGEKIKIGKYTFLIKNGRFVKV